MEEGADGAGLGSQAASGSRDLAEAVAVARDLLRHISSASATGVSDAGVAILRQTDEVLARLAPPVVETIEPAAPKEASPHHRVVLDVSDLLGYFQHNRLPTGIQRVQSELVFNLIKAEAEHGGQLCCFVEARGQWVEVDAPRFMALCLQSRGSADPLEPGWRAAVRGVNEAIASNPAMVFPEGAVLVNVGTSWWLPNYFIYVRQAKAASKVRYVPLIHDLIPIMTPEYCAPELVREFMNWFVAVLDHADFFLANSEATKRDVLRAAAKLGKPIAEDRVAVLRLDADFRAPEAERLPATSRFKDPFVLFVSTIEARKNQLGTLDVWTTLIAKHGPHKVPRLVLVGKRGFQSDIVLNRLDMNEDLRERVTILAGIEETELQALYRDCLFTLYPSFYEGWGLPVTESLCYGKVPLIADNSSLREAGGDSALYFKTGSSADMRAKLEKLILDGGFRKQQEAKIAETFRPRTWSEITAQAAARIEAWAASPAESWGGPPAVHPSSYYPMMQIGTTRLREGLGTAEPYRRGLGWHQVEAEGCWIRASGAELEMVIAEEAARIGFELLCPPGASLRYRVEMVGEDEGVEGEIDGGGAPSWAFLDLPGKRPGDRLRFRLVGTTIRPPVEGERASNEEEQARRDRRSGLGLKGFFLLAANPAARLDFLEAAALGALPGLSYYRDRQLPSKTVDSSPANH